MKPIFIFTLFLIILSCNNQPQQVANTVIKDSVILLDTARKPVILPEQVLQTGGDDKKLDSIIIAGFDSLSVAVGWQNIQPANPDACFQKQYTGYIGNKKATININLRAINIRQDKDILMWVAIGDTLTEAYFYEGNIFGKTQNDDRGKEPLCKNCRKDTLVLRAKYILGSMGKPVAIRFNADSASLYGFYYNGDNNTITRFTLNQSTPSLPLNYMVYRFHKHQKWNGNDVAEVPATVVLAANLPDTSYPAYKTLLQNQVGGVLDTSEQKGFTNIQQVVPAYKKYFQEREKGSNVEWARSMVGGYDVSTVLYNQDSFVVIKTESFIGDAGYYGDMGTGFLSYDITTGKFLKEEDVMQEGWDDGPNIDKLKSIYQIRFRGFAFVCPLGVAFRISGNHGWEVNSYFVGWKLIKPFIKPQFIQQHSGWFN